jgi:hypothetical protein
MAFLCFWREEDARLWLRMQVACRRSHGLVNNLQGKCLPVTPIRATNVFLNNGVEFEPKKGTQ